MENRALAVILVATAASCWGVIGIFTRTLSSYGIAPLEISMIRCIISVAIVLAILLIKDRGLLRIAPRDIWMFIGTGLFSVAIFNTLYFTAQQMVSLSIAAVLLYTAPFFVMILSLFLFKEEMTVQKIAALLVAFTGCVLTAGIIGSDAPINASGILYGVGAGFCYALYTIFSIFALKKYHPFTITFYTFLVASVCLLPLSDVGNIVNVAMSGDAWMYMVGIAVLCTTIPYFLYTAGLKSMEGGKASIISYVEPIVATVVGLLMFGETPTPLNLVGIVLILVSLVMLNAKSLLRKRRGS